MSNQNPDETASAAESPSIDPNLQKILVSTTSRLVGEFRSPNLSITHAWPNFGSRNWNARLEEGRTSRSAYLILFRTENLERKLGPQPSPAGWGDIFCVYMALLYGKRFDNHGAVEELGRSHLPDLTAYSELIEHNLPQNSHKVRPDVSVPLNLAEFSRVHPALFEDSRTEKAVRTFRSAGRFYLEAVQALEAKPDVAYLHLVTAGEILSGFFEYEIRDLLDIRTEKVFASIEAECKSGHKHVDHLLGRLYQVRQKFLRTLMQLLNENFFVAGKPHVRLQRDGIEQRIKAAYDLRSKYVHTGFPYGVWVGSVGARGGAELQFGTPIIGDKDLEKLLERAPTFFGLARMIRFALLSLLHRNVCRVDDALNAPTLSELAERANTDSSPIKSVAIRPKARPKPKPKPKTKSGARPTTETTRKSATKSKGRAKKAAPRPRKRSS